MAKNYMRGPQRRAYMPAIGKGQPAIGPRMPGDLPEGAQKIWKSLVPMIRRGPMELAATDGPMLADLCLSLYRLGQCEQDIEARGIIVDGRRNPALLAAGPYRENVARLAAKFGLTPADRARIQKPDDGPEEQSVAAILFEGAITGAGREP